MSESDSDPRQDDAGEETSIPAPEGWVWIALGSTSAHLVPDITHPSHPYALANGKSPYFQRSLDSDADVQGFIAKIRPILAAEEEDPFPQGVFVAIDEFSKDHGPNEVPWWVKHIYILSTVLDRKVDEATITASIAASVQPLSLRLAPDGHFIMSFTNASQSEREAYSKLIESAQNALGHRKSTGGRPAKKDHPISAEQARTAAKLHHWPSPGWSHDEIAELFDWNGGQDARRQRVRRAIRDGEDLLRKEIGKDWATRPPPRIAERNG